jgi:hypothetical protein
MGVHHDLSPSGLGAAGDRRVTPLLWAQGTSTVLGIDLKCSESRPLRRSPVAGQKPEACRLTAILPTLAVQAICGTVVAAR